MLLRAGRQMSPHIERSLPSPLPERSHSLRHEINRKAPLVSGLPRAGIGAALRAQRSLTRRVTKGFERKENPFGPGCVLERRTDHLRKAVERFATQGVKRFEVSLAQLRQIIAHNSKLHGSLKENKGIQPRKLDAR